MESASIYTLSEPDGSEVRYVGITINEPSRKKAHMGIGGKRTSPRALWLLDLKSRGLKPIIKFIETFNFQKGDTELLKERENFWINEYRSKGNNLLNLKVGGASGQRPSIKTKLKISEAGKLRMSNPDNREHLRLKLTGKPMHTAETKEIIAASKRGIPRSDEVNAALQAGSKKYKEDAGFHPMIRCVKCGTIIKFIKAPKFFVEGIGHIHKKCRKLL